MHNTLIISVFFLGGG